MDQAEVLDWLRQLPFAEKIGARANNGATSIYLRPCVNDHERIEVLHDLLIHAGRDRMSDDDAVVCLEALEYLEVRRGIQLPQTTRRCEACKNYIELTVLGHKIHVARCCKTGKGARVKDKRGHGETVTRRQGPRLSRVQTGVRDGLQGTAKALPGMLQGAEGQGSTEPGV